MASADYRIFGLGLNGNDLRYVGWTQRSIEDEKDAILGELMNGEHDGVGPWVDDCMGSGMVSIFEIESAPSIEDARSRAGSLCDYFKSLGLDVSADRC